MMFSIFFNVTLHFCHKSFVWSCTKNNEEIYAYTIGLKSYFDIYTVAEVLAVELTQLLKKLLILNFKYYFFVICL